MFPSESYLRSHALLHIFSIYFRPYVEYIEFDSWVRHVGTSSAAPDTITSLVEGISEIEPTVSYYLSAPLPPG